MSLQEIRQRRESVQTIHDVVGAMRAVAAGRIQGAQRVLQSVNEYHEIVMRAADIVLRDPTVNVPNSVERYPLGLLVLTSEQPLCGPLSQNVVSLATQRLDVLRQGGEVRLLVVGRRGMGQFSAQGVTPDVAEPATTSLRGMRDLVKRLARTLSRGFASGDLGSVRVIYSRYVSISEQVLTEELILPPDFGRLDRVSSRTVSENYQYMPPAELFAGIVAEYAFVSLYRIAAEMFASEQASRLVAMDVATRNTEQMVGSLRAQEQRERQNEITRQVLEVSSGRLAANSDV